MICNIIKISFNVQCDCSQFLDCTFDQHSSTFNMCMLNVWKICIRIADCNNLYDFGLI
jgi:hypothetical protein